VACNSSYEELLPHSVQVETGGEKYCCVSLERLIQMKRAAGRPKDLEVIATLQALLEERQNRPSSGNR
jgi:predicted nucleotidyltransferase